MPLYHVHIAFERFDPYPPRDDLQTVEATDPLDAIEHIKQRRIFGAAGIEVAWVRVVVDWGPNGEVLKAAVAQVPLTPIAPDN